jgi:small subunit ribosomal protein S13
MVNKAKGKEQLQVKLQKLYGIGFSFSDYLCCKIGMRGFITVSEVSRYSMRELSRVMHQECLIGLDLYRLIKSNIRLKVKLKSYQGLRHTLGLPVNGQNTKNNRKTARKLLRMNR